MDTRPLQGVLLVLLATAAAGFQLRFGRCSNPPVQKNFDINKYAGTWYEIQKLPTSFEIGKCGVAKYKVLANGTVSCYNAELTSDGTTHSIHSIAEVNDPAKPARMSVRLGTGGVAYPLWILFTDYKTHSVHYSCINYFRFFYVEYAWILSRTPVLPDDVVYHLREKLCAVGVVVAALTTSDQSGCELMLLEEV